MTREEWHMIALFVALWAFVGVMAAIQMKRQDARYYGGPFCEYPLDRTQYDYPMCEFKLRSA